MYQTKRRQEPWDWITELLCSSAKPASERKIGIEIERIAIWPDGRPFLYREGVSGGKVRPGAEELLRELESRHHWPAIRNEQSLPLGFSSPHGKVSLEPGSQVELSSDPARDLRSLAADVEDFERKVSEITDPWGLLWIGIGVNPLNRVEEIDVIPSTRYHIMTDYLGKRARLGTSMMRLTSSVQLNLDYSSETEAIEMLRVSLAMAPLSYALFGNSPLSEGKETGSLSYREKIWQETDPDRTGLLPEAFEDGFDFHAYAKYVWGRPLMYVQDQDSHFVPAVGRSLHDISNGELSRVVADETNQMNGVRELFTETRLKPGYVELRSVDGLRVADRNGAAAFWLGLLYSSDARALAWERLGRLSIAARRQLLDEATRVGLKAQHGNTTLGDVAKELLPLSEKELKARGFGEERFLAPVRQTIAEEKNPAQRLLEKWRSEKWDAAALLRHLAQP